MWEETKAELRKFAVDRTSWLWVGIGCCIVPLMLAANALWGPGMNVAWAFAGMFIAWSIALQIWTGRRATTRDNEAAVVDMSVDIAARIVLDIEETERHTEHSKRWYRVFVGDNDIGGIEYDPAAHRKIQWSAHYRTRIPTSSAFGSKREACKSLVRHAYH